MNKDTNLWTRQFFAERWPEPITPLSKSLLLDKFVIEFMYYHPIAEWLCDGLPPAKVHNGYVYMNVTMFKKLFEYLNFPVPDYILELFPRDMQKRMNREKFGIPRLSFVSLVLRVGLKEHFLNKIDIHILDNPNHWEKFSQKFVAEIEKLNALRFPALSLDQLWNAYCFAENLLFEYRKIHLGSLLIVNLLYQLIGIMLKSWADPELKITRSDLVSGIRGSKTIETNKAIWLLSREALKIPDLALKFKDHSAKEILKLLENGNYPEFYKMLKGFLDNYGHRSSNSYELSSPAWKMDPTPVLEAIANYVQADEEICPFHLEEEKVKHRENATKVLLSSLKKGYTNNLFPLKYKTFKDILNLTSKYILLRENQRFLFDSAITSIRYLFQAMGERLRQRSMIENANDIFYLTLDEIHSSLRKNLDFKAIVSERKAERARNLSYTPPMFLYGDEPYEENREPVPDVLEGLGVSPGVRKGTVRIINGPKEFGFFRKGEVLVTTGTDPGWSHLFVSAAALVAEIGGLLSHGAIVAREYGLPAVVGVSMATKILKTGQEVIVDGTHGLIRLLGF